MKLFAAYVFASILSFNMHKMNSVDYGSPDTQDQRPLFSFGVIADVQYADQAPAGNRYYRSSCMRLIEAYRQFKADTVDFVINLGDLIERDFASYTPLLRIIDSSGLKTYHITGNHDYSVESKLKKKLPVLTGSEKGYYSFVNHNFRFIFLNGNEISVYAPGSRSDIKKSEAFIAEMKCKGEINALDWNGGISPRQISWLKKQLDEAVINNQKVFILCHFPVFPENVHNLLNHRVVLELIDKYHNIIAWFNGHNHAGNYGNFNLIHFVTFKGMVDTELYGSFAVIDVFRKKVLVNGFGREKTRILEY